MIDKSNANPNRTQVKRKTPFHSSGRGHPSRPDILSGKNGDSALFLEEKIGRCPHFSYPSSFSLLGQAQTIVLVCLCLFVFCGVKRRERTFLSAIPASGGTSANSGQECSPPSITITIFLDIFMVLWYSLFILMEVR